jgi:hypothetical protein
VSKASTVSFTPLTASIAAGWRDPVAAWELHPLKTNTFHGARSACLRASYKLCPERFALLKMYRGEGELVLTTDKGEPLVSYSLEDGKFAGYDVIQSAWNRLSEIAESAIYRVDSCQGAG